MSKKRASSPTGAASSTREPAAGTRRTSLAHRQANTANSADLSDDEAGEFEDRWEDEYESEEIVDNESDDEEDLQQLATVEGGVNGMDLDAGANAENGREDSPVPYLPTLGQGNQTLEEDEQLVPDLSSYVMLHHARLAWPCLSFDVLRDVN